MATIDPKTGTTYATTNWAHYSTGRPAYPKSLTELIYAYRRTSVGPAGWNRLVDIGAGSGIAAVNFMNDFAIIHNSDPSPANEQSAKDFLINYAKQQRLSPTFEFSVAVGEDAWISVGEGQADLAICATASHFIDGDGLANSIAKMLTPGGTCAVFSYWMPKFPNCSAEFNRMFEKTFDDLVLTPMWNSASEEQRAKIRKTIERRMTGNGNMDSLPLPEKDFSRRQRVYINSGKDGIPFSNVYGRFKPMDGTAYGVSRVEGTESRVFYETGVDAQAEGWVFEVDKMFLKNFFDTIRPAQGRDAKEAVEAYRRWEEAFDAECTEGKVLSSWPCYVALGTRK